MTIILESGIAASPLTWLPVAKLLEPEFFVVVHKRGGRRNLLPELASELHAVLHKAALPGPYLLVGHSFGALVIRQFAALYPEETAALLYVDGLTPGIHIAPRTVIVGVAVARIASVLAGMGLIGPLLPHLERRIRPIEWAFQELRKLPHSHQVAIQNDWAMPRFYSDLGRSLAALPRNLQLARALPNPPFTCSLYSDYPDPTGQRVENAGHWIQIDKPEVVADAVRALARVIIRQKGA